MQTATVFASVFIFTLFIYLYSMQADFSIVLF